MSRTVVSTTPTNSHTIAQTQSRASRGAAGDNNHAHTAPSSPAPATEAPASLV
jgi:hypothetical protein